ncbi:hypothetical protein [Streptosporangium jomthongense]|uniref:Uncharacterized protein n=1 Tax=Streptosporangium jomthongense TaxID=1193683 RepID=A0ABV8F584_9ACTN
MTFTDKGDTFNGLSATCGSCGTTSTAAHGFAGLTCTCGRVLSGSGRSNEPDLSRR